MALLFLLISAETFLKIFKKGKESWHGFVLFHSTFSCFETNCFTSCINGNRSEKNLYYRLEFRVSCGALNTHVLLSLVFLGRFSGDRFKCIRIDFFFPLWEILKCFVCAFILCLKQEQVLSSVMLRCFQADTILDFRRSCKLNIWV